MEFRVLGPVEVFGDGGLIDIGPRMPRAVLAVLVINANRVVSVDQLIDDLWGEEPPPAAMGALRAYVSNLRRALEPQRAKGSPPTVLVTQPPGYLLHLRPSEVDAGRFEALVAEARAHSSSGRLEAARDALGQAIGLWRGPPYADLAFEPFVQVEVARLNELYHGACETLVEAEMRLGRHADVVADLERMVTDQPLRERRWELLALALYRCGRQAEALRALAEARRRLREDLGIDIGASLRRRESEILGQDRSLDWRPPVTAPAAPRSDDGRPPEDRRELPDSVMVGRDDELSTLLAVLARASRGRGEVVLVSGEPGIGKTRLAEELAARAADEGAYVAWGRCHEVEGAPAFWPWVQIVRSLAECLDPATLRAALGPGAAEIAQVVPEIKEAVPDLHPVAALDSATARTRLYEALTRFVLRVAASRPLVLILDDLHWADPPSVQLLNFLACQIEAVPAAVLGTFREGEISGSHSLNVTLANLARQPNMSRLSLGGLQPSDVARLLTDASGEGPSEELLDAVFGRSEGNPFFVGELVRLIRTEGASSTEVPGRVRDVVRRRLALLPEDSSRLLTVAAVLGRDFDLDVVALAGERDLDVVIEQIEAGVGARLVSEVPGAVGWYRFSHALVRETLYDDLSSLRRARLHRRVAEALEARGGAEPTEVAHHYWQAAAVVGGVHAALAWAEKAAEQALSRLAYEQAEELLNRALDLIERLPPGEERDRRELNLQGRLRVLLAMVRGKAAADVGRAAARAAELGRRLGDGPQLARALYSLASFHAMRGEIEVSAGLAEELLSLSAGSGDEVVRLLGECAAGYCDLYQGDLPSAKAHLERALVLPDALRDVSLIPVLLQHPAVGCWGYTAIVLALMGEVDRAREMIGDAVAFAKALGHPFTWGFALHYDTWLGAILHDPPHVRVRAEETLVACRNGEFPMWAAASGVLLGWAQARLGEPEAGLAAMQARLAEWEATGARRYQHSFLAFVAEGYLLTDRPRDALSALDRGLASAEETAERFYEAELHRLRGETLAILSPELGIEAEASLRRAVAVARAQGATLLQARAEESLDAFLSAASTVTSTS